MRGRKVVAGNAIGSRFPILNQQIAFTHGKYVEEKDPEPNTRNYQTCNLDIGDGASLSLLNHHACWSKDPNGAPEATAKMQQVCDAAMALGGPTIVTGDMNVVPESEPMEVFKGKLEDLTGSHNIETTLTRLAHAFDCNNIVPCDHVLVSPNINVRQFYASNAIVSDHKALILEFDLK